MNSVPFLDLSPRKILRKIIPFALAAILLAGSINGGKASGPPMLTEKDSGRTVTLRVGEKLILNVRNPAGGGYTMVSPRYDQGLLKLVSQQKVKPESGPRRKLGDFGRIIFEWEATNPGETELVIEISRPWEKEQAPLQYVKLKIRVIK